jgi:hypothetical protein
LAGFLPLSAAGVVLPMQPPRPASSPLEILIGRSLAAIAHPVAAWRVFSPVRRLLLLFGYSIVAYIATLWALFAL